MMKKSGYFQRTGYIAYDAEGMSHEVVLLYIEGLRYAIRRNDLIRAVSGRVCVQVEALVHNWQYYLGTVTGLAQISASGKALNIDLFGIGGFTVSLPSLRSVIYGKERFAIIVRIPKRPESIVVKNTPCHQERFEAAV